MLHDLSHSQLQLLGFQINPLSHIPLSINSLHSHLHLSSFHLCLLLQTLESKSTPEFTSFMSFSMCFVLLANEIKLNTLTFMSLTTSGTHNLAYGSLTLLQLPLHLFTLILKG